MPRSTRIFAVLLLLSAPLAACGPDDSAPIVLPPNPGGSGGDAPSIECDADGDGVDGPQCGGDDCVDRIGTIHPGAPELCGNATDDDCDGATDENCDCTPGDVRGCYPGDESTRYVGACADGLQVCTADGTWGGCEGAVLPADEPAACDGIDQDCDGVADEAARNACGFCGELPKEICGNGLDDDCDGAVDPPALCNLTCAGIDADHPDPEWLECCAWKPGTLERASRPVRYSFRCVEWPGLPTCASPERECVSLDGTTPCTKRCNGTTCLCGFETDRGDLVDSGRCGFETPCAYLGCEGRTNQPCYSGPPQTLGVGICRAGRADCQESGGWGGCVGEVLPAPEICGNGLDDDCDGAIDEQDGVTGRRCSLPRCASDAVELCDNGLDDDCDGAVDEGCAAEGEQACYRGPPATRNVGNCTDGVQTAVDGRWGPCLGDVLPAGEICGDGIDGDCNGFGGEGQPEDPGCLIPADDPPCADQGGVPPDACGGCGQAPCSSVTFTDLASCTEPGRTCEGVEALDGDPEILTLPSDKRTESGGDWFYLFTSKGSAVPDPISIRRIQVGTGEVEWEVSPALGLASRLHVAPDGTLWFGTRMFIAWLEGWTNEYAALYHIGRDGSLLCKLPVEGGVEALAVDPHGFVWVANGIDGRSGSGPSVPGYVARKHLLKVHGTAVEATQPDGTPWPDGVPRCVLLDLAPNDPAEAGIEVATDAALMDMWIDTKGTLWGIDDSSWSIEEPLLRVDTRTLAQELIVPWMLPMGIGPDDGFYGIVNSLRDAEIVRIDPHGPYDDPARYRTSWRVPSIAWGLLVSADGAFWAIPGPLARFGPELDLLTGALVTHPVASPPLQQTEQGLVEVRLTSGPLFEDTSGRIWLAASCGVSGPMGLAGWDPVIGDWIVHCDLGAVPQPTLDRRGATSHFLRERGVVGRWTQTIDAVWPGVRWLTLDWEQFVPEGASVKARVAFADTEAELDAAPTVCGPFLEPPAELRGCPGQGRRFARIEFVLRSHPAVERPQIAHVSLEWTRP